VNLEKQDCCQLSVIITSYTTERLNDIFDALDSVKYQTYNHMETIFVIERSTELYEAIKDYSKEKKLKNFEIIFRPEKIGISEARNTGIKHASGDFIAFLDDDAVLSPNWAEEVVSTFSKFDNIIGVTGPVLPLWEKEYFKWFPEEFYWMLGCSGWTDFHEYREVDYGWGVNMCFKKEVFYLVSFNNGYSEGAQSEGKRGPVGDDVDFSYAARKETGKKILFNPNLVVMHKVNGYKLTSKYFRRYSYWQGYSDAMHKKNSSDSISRSRTEKTILRRIIKKLMPSIIVGLINNRSIALKQLRVTVESLFYFSLGYFSYKIPGVKVFTEQLI
jgi:glucosyl-dolichyl phosphate glucuronosyltransferase